MSLLVPVSGNVDPAELNRRNLPNIPKSLREQDPKKFPPVYIFNVGPRRHEFPPNERGARYLEPCPKGQAYSEPLIFRNIEMEIYDLADGGGNMGLLQEEGLDKAMAMIHGGPSGEGLSIDTSNLEWHGVFVTENQKPTQAELAEARKKFMAMQRLIYDQGSQLKMRGHSFPLGSRDPDLYNEACNILGVPVLFGVSEHTMDRCVFCKETVMEGALVCKHCGLRQDSDEAKKLRGQKAS